jgi:phage shock protein A
MSTADQVRQALDDADRDLARRAAQSVDDPEHDNDPTAEQIADAILTGTPIPTPTED